MLFTKVRNDRKRSKTGKIITVAVAAIAAMAFVPNANASIWRTTTHDVDRGSGFAITHVEHDYYTGYFNQGKLLFNGRMRIKSHGKLGTIVNVNAHVNCYEYDYEYDEYGNPIKPGDLYYHESKTVKWSYRARTQANIHFIGMTADGPWDGCEVTATAYSRDSGPVVLKLQHKRGR
jgi:hypothetical protein